MTMRKFIFSIFCAGILPLFCSCAGDLLHLEEGTPSDLSVDQVLSRMHRATDPKGVYASVNSYRMRQKVVSADAGQKDEYISEILWRAPDYAKQISYRNGEPFLEIIFRSDRAWYINPKTKKSKKIEGEDFKLVKAFSDMLRPGENYKEIFKDVTIDRCADPKTGILYYRLICRVDDERVAPYVFYIDPKTFLTDRFETILYADGPPQLYIGDSEDYVWRGDVLMPLKSLVTVGGKTDVTTITEYVLNPEIPLSEFDTEKPWNH